MDSIQGQLQSGTSRGHTAIYFKNPKSDGSPFSVGSVIRFVIENEADSPQTYKWEVKVNGQRVYEMTTHLEAHQAEETNLIASKPGLLEIKFAEHDLELKAIIE